MEQFGIGEPIRRVAPIQGAGSGRLEGHTAIPRRASGCMA